MIAGAAFDEGAGNARATALAALVGGSNPTTGLRSRINCLCGMPSRNPGWPTSVTRAPRLLSSAAGNPAQPSAMPTTSQDSQQSTRIVCIVQTNQGRRQDARSGTMSGGGHGWRCSHRGWHRRAGNGQKIDQFEIEQNCARVGAPHAHCPNLAMCALDWTPQERWSAPRGPATRLCTGRVTLSRARTPQVFS